MRSATAEEAGRTASPREGAMTAVYIIAGFVLLYFALNVVDFGRLD